MQVHMTNGEQSTRVGPGLVAFWERRGWSRTDSPTSPLDGLTVKGLRTFAQERGIDLGAAKKKPEIRAAIEGALTEGEPDGE